MPCPSTTVAYIQMQRLQKVPHRVTQVEQSMGVSMWNRGACSQEISSLAYGIVLFHVQCQYPCPYAHWTWDICFFDSCTCSCVCSPAFGYYPAAAAATQSSSVTYTSSGKRVAHPEPTLVIVQMCALRPSAEIPTFAHLLAEIYKVECSSCSSHKWRNWGAVK